MDLKKIVTGMGDPVKEHYTVEDITLDDIAPPSEHFLRVVRKMGEFSFVNSFTTDNFTEEIRKRFVSPKR